MAIDTAAEQKGTEHMAQPDPDPDPDRTASEVPSAVDRDSTTEDLPTTGDDNSSPMEAISHNEDIPVDVASTLTHEKLQPVRECPAPVYNVMAKVSTGGPVLLKVTRAMLRQCSIPQREPSMVRVWKECRTHPETSQKLEETPRLGLYTQVQEGKALEHARMYTQ